MIKLDIEDDGDITLHATSLGTLAGKATVQQVEDTCTARFDAAIQRVTYDRGDVYGPPGKDFARAQLIKRAVQDCPHDGIRHAMEMIGVKMARLTHTPDHEDSIHDIAGYARTMAMLLDAGYKG